jgi:signal transduction histidine kinase
MEQALRTSEKYAAMGRVAAVLAHEISNPLAAVTNAFYLLRQHPSLDEETQQLAEIAHTEITRVSPVPIGLVPAHSRWDVTNQISGT